MLLAIGRSPPSDHEDSPPPTKVQSRSIPMSRPPISDCGPVRYDARQSGQTCCHYPGYGCILFTLPFRPIHCACVCTSPSSTLFRSDQYAPRILPHADVTSSDTSIAPDGVLIGGAQAVRLLEIQNKRLLVFVSLHCEDAMRQLRSSFAAMTPGPPRLHSHIVHVPAKSQWQCQGSNSA